MVDISVTLWWVAEHGWGAEGNPLVRWAGAHLGSLATGALKIVLVLVSGWLAVWLYVGGGRVVRRGVVAVLGVLMAYYGVILGWNLAVVA